MTDNETLRELFPRNDRKGNYILVPIDKYEELISKAAALEDIRAEIEAVRMTAIKNMEYAKGLEVAWNIIDRHIKGETDERQ